MVLAPDLYTFGMTHFVGNGLGFNLEIKLLHNLIIQIPVYTNG